MTTTTAPQIGSGPRIATRPFLLGDAALTGVNGLAYALLPNFLSEHLGAPAGLIRGLGIFLVIVAADIVVLATRRPIPRWGLLALVSLNAAWVIASLWYAIAADLTALGRVWVVVQALIVAAFAEVQWIHARRL